MEESCCSAAERSDSDKEDAHALLTDDSNDGLPVDETRDKIDDVVDLNILECPLGCTTSKECEHPLDRGLCQKQSSADEDLFPIIRQSTVHLSF